MYAQKVEKYLWCSRIYIYSAASTVTEIRKLCSFGKVTVWVDISGYAVSCNFSTLDQIFKDNGLKAYIVPAPSDKCVLDGITCLCPLCLLMSVKDRVFPVRNYFPYETVILVIYVVFIAWLQSRPILLQHQKRSMSAWMFLTSNRYGNSKPSSNSGRQSFRRANLRKSRDHSAIVSAISRYDIVIAKKCIYLLIYLICFILFQRFMRLNIILKYKLARSRHGGRFCTQFIIKTERKIQHGVTWWLWRIVFVAETKIAMWLN